VISLRLFKTQTHKGSGLPKIEFLPLNVKSHSEKKKRRVASIIITLAIIAALILSGPSSAIVLRITTDKPVYASIEKLVTFTVGVDIEYETERVPIKNITLKIHGPTDKTCVFTVNGNPIQGCENIQISKASWTPYNYSSAPLWGYGYGFTPTYGYGFRNETFGTDYGYGHGAGYVWGNKPYGAELQYTIQWNISAEGAPEGSYTAELEAIAQEGSTYRVFMTRPEHRATFSITTLTFSFSGYTYDVNGNVLSNTNASVEVYQFLPGQGPQLVASFSDLSDDDGFFNVTGLPNITNYFFKPVIIKYSSTDPSRAEYIGQSLPEFPYNEFHNLGSVKFFLKEAATINISAINSTNDPIRFHYMIKDTKLGYPISENFKSYVYTATLYVPADRNYSLMIYPENKFPVYYDLNNISDYSAPRYIEKQFNCYNITLPAPVEASKILLFANAFNKSGDGIYYGGFREISPTYSSSETMEANFTMISLLGQPANITLRDFMGNEVNVSTKKVAFRLVDEDGSSPRFAHVEVELDYSTYGAPLFTWMVDVGESDNGIFRVPLLSADLKRMNIFSPDFAPLKKSFSSAQLNTLAPNIINITLYSFKPGAIEEGEVFTDLYISLFKSSDTCDVPSPPSGCLLSPESLSDEFNPLSVIMGGGKISFRMKKQSNNITVHYVDVDLMASGPPDAVFDSSSTTNETGNIMEDAWRFGSRGPEIYDHVLLGMPYNESKYDENGEFRVRIEKFYDDEWNVTWNINVNTTDELPSEYSDYLEDEYNAYVNISKPAMLCSKTNTSATCYVDTSLNMVWIKIPHFSGVGPEFSGEKDATPPVITIVSVGGDESSPYTTSDSTPTIELRTDEDASCRYATSNISYESMTNNFTSTNGTTHSATLSLDEGSYTYYAACKDLVDNEASKKIEFTITAPGRGPSGVRETHVIPSITPGETVTIEVSRGDEIGVTEVSITVKNEVSDVKITVEKLEEKPEEVVKDVVGMVYRYLKITTLNIGDEDIESAKVKFKVEKAWLEENNLDPETVLLNRYHDNEWEGLSTELVGEDDEYYYYEASLTGFSIFAITAKEKEVVTTTSMPVTTSTAPVTTTSTVPAKLEAPKRKMWPYWLLAVVAILLVASLIFFLKPFKPRRRASWKRKWLLK